MILENGLIFLILKFFIIKVLKILETFPKITFKTYSKNEFVSVSLVNKSILSEIIFKIIIFQVFFHKTL